ncbi:MAG: hypothetical protein RSC93_07230 [Erysipelotrichaceae bacterium]
MNNFKNETKEWKEKIQKFMKKEKTFSEQISSKNKYRNFLLKQSVDSVGAVMLNDNKITTRDNTQYCVYRISYKTPNGIEKSIDDENHENMVQLMNSLEHEVKVLFPREKKDNLDNGIKYYVDLLLKEENKQIQEVLEERIRIMKIFNAEKYVSTIFYVRVESDDIFRKTSKKFLNIEQIKDNKLIEFQSLLNNEME